MKHLAKSIMSLIEVSFSITDSLSISLSASAASGALAAMPTEFSAVREDLR